MKFEHTEVFNFEGALRGMRNPLASWHKSDSYWEEKYVQHKHGSYSVPETEYVIGPKDMDLAKRLCNAGPEHRKFLRQIQVCVDITAPLYWWKEFDTYKIGTTANSTSTMHKLASTPITLECFEIDDFDPNLVYYSVPPYSMFDYYPTEINNTTGMLSEIIIEQLEYLRQKYNETKDKRYWKELVRWLPNGWLQTRTITMNYENLRSICNQRANHKLTEWHKFIEWAHTLPYAAELIFNEEVAK